MELKSRHIVVGGVFAAVIHLAVGAMVLHAPEKTGAIGSGDGGLDVSLALSGGVVGALESAEAQEVVEDAPIRAAEDSLPDGAEDLPADAAKTEELASTEVETAPMPATLETPDAAEPLPRPSTEPTPIAEVTQIDPVPVDVISAIEPAKVTMQSLQTVETVENAVAAAPLEVVPAAEPRRVAALIEPAQDTLAPPPSNIRAAETVQETQARGVFETQAPAQSIKPSRRPDRPRAKQTPTRAAAEAPQQSLKTEARLSAKPAQSARKADAGDRWGATDAAGDAAAAAVEAEGAGGDRQAAKQSFTAKIAAILQRHRKYPRRARSRGQQGSGQLFFVMGADGRVLRTELHSSSGHRLLDKEILALLERAQPLPPIPAELGVTKLSLIVPISFTLR